MEEISMPRVVVPRFRPIENLIKDSLLLVFRHWAPLLTIQVIAYAAAIFILIFTVLIFLGPVFVKMIHGGRAWADVRPIITGYSWIGIIFFAVVSMAVMTWSYGAMIAAIGFKDNGMAPIAGSMKRGVKLFIPFFIMMVFILLASIGAALFFIFPAIILMVGFSLSWYVMILEDVSLFQALGTSWRITKGLKWPIFGRMLLMMLVIIGATMALNIAGVFPLMSLIVFPVIITFQFVVFPYALAYVYCLYEDVRAVRKDVCGLSGGIFAWLVIFLFVAIAIMTSAILLIAHFV